MSIDIKAEYEKLDGKWPTFEYVETKLSSRPDIHAFILLNQLVPGDLVMLSPKHLARHTIARAFGKPGVSAR